MSRDTNNVIPVPITVTGMPEGYCFTTVAQLIRDLSGVMFAQVPEDITNVDVGNIQPNSTSRQHMWVALSNSGKFLGIRMFDGANWQQVYPAPGMVFEIYGTPDFPDSNTPPPGFQLIDGSTSGFTSPQVTHIQSTYYPTPGTPPYTIYKAIFVGF